MVEKLPFALQRPFFHVLMEQGAIDVFEQWLYQEEQLAHYLSNDDYLALISLDFNDKYILHEMGKIMHLYLDEVLYYKNRLEFILSELIQQPSHLEYINELYEMYCHGYLFLDLAREYGSWAMYLLDGRTDCILTQEDLNDIQQQAKELYDALTHDEIILLIPPDGDLTIDAYRDLRDLNNIE